MDNYCQAGLQSFYQQTIYPTKSRLGLESISNPTYLNLSELIRTYLNLSKPIQTYLNTSEPVQVYLNLFESIWTYQILSDHIQFWPIIKKRPYIYLIFLHKIMQRVNKSSPWNPNFKWTLSSNQRAAHSTSFLPKVVRGSSKDIFIVVFQVGISLEDFGSF